MRRARAGAAHLGHDVGPDVAQDLRPASGRVRGRRLGVEKKGRREGSCVCMRVCVCVRARARLGVGRICNPDGLPTLR